MTSLDEIILPFPAAPEALGRTTHIRSTLLTSSIESVRARGHYERYCALLPADLRDEIINSVAGQWLTIDRAEAHYAACDALPLTFDEQVAMGRDVSRRIHATFMGLVVKLARGAGVTPWVLLPRGNLLYNRVLRGGGTQVTKIAAQEVRVELAGVSLTTIPYFRHALLGLYEAGLGLFASHVVVREHVQPEVPRTAMTVLRIQWG